MNHLMLEHIIHRGRYKTLTKWTTAMTQTTTRHRTDHRAGQAISRDAAGLVKGHPRRRAAYSVVLIGVQLLLAAGGHCQLRCCRIFVRFQGVASNGRTSDERGSSQRRLPTDNRKGVMAFANIALDVCLGGRLGTHL